MTYIIIELQVNESGQVSNFVTTHNDANQAESAYHMILGAAAISNVAKHSAILMNDEGYTIARQTYHHGAQPAPEE